ncbi:sulfite exporter TauE/SafE family protein [Nonomuraea dietziae]|uniref:sulfite exporter TauE/SafE family protein n=1 Tax=Nonomuraea dietziae TaxID=65515 RepID=UPI0033FD74F4
MLILTLASALAIGIALGLFGGGGSILAVPALIYLAGMPAKSAIAASLFIVAVTSAVGVIGHARAGRIRWRTDLLFGAAGMAGAYAGGLLGPHLPETILLAAFAIMMVVAAVAMIRGRKASTSHQRDDLPLAHILIDGLIVGIVTGLVGAGGGFLVVPALVLLGGLPMGVAVGTSLVVIAMKSAAGLLGYLHSVPIDWSLAVPFATLAVIGGLIGARLADRLDADKLRCGFGWFVLILGGFVLAQQVPALL